MLGLRGDFAEGFKLMGFFLIAAWVCVMILTGGEALAGATKLYGGALLGVYALARGLQAVNDKV